jgi:DNA-directed RNA polymerase subunit M/transcription elongation factor TFIIS
MEMNEVEFCVYCGSVLFVSDGRCQKCGSEIPAAQARRLGIDLKSTKKIISRKMPKERIKKISDSSKAYDNWKVAKKIVTNEEADQ